MKNFKIKTKSEIGNSFKNTDFQPDDQLFKVTPGSNSTHHLSISTLQSKSLNPVQTSSVQLTTSHQTFSKPDSVDSQSIDDDPFNNDLMGRIRNLTQVARSKIVLMKSDQSLPATDSISQKGPFLTDVNLFKKMQTLQKENMPNIGNDFEKDDNFKIDKDLADMLSFAVFLVE